MRTSSYDPSRSKKKSRSPKPRPKTLPIRQSDESTKSTPVESPASPSADTLAPKEVPESKLGMLEESNEIQTGNAENDGKPVVESDQCNPPLESSTSVSTTEMDTHEGRSLVNGMGVEPVEELASLGDPAKDYINAQGVRFITVDPLNKESGRIHVAYGLPCIRELLRFLISLINPLERQNNETMINVGLR